MKRGIIIYFLNFIIIFCSTISGQDMLEKTKNQIKSPQLSDIIRYGNMPIAKNAGRIDLSVDIAQIKDQDFDLSVSIRYNSAGFTPAKNSGNVGLNWSISNIGVITRDIRGIPDDYYRRYSAGEYKQLQSGFLYFVKNKDRYNPADIMKNPNAFINIRNFNSNLLELRNVKLKETEEFCRTIIEVESDIYNFNFGDYRGQFVINYDGSVSVRSDNGKKIEVILDDYNYQDFTTTNKTHSSIKIRTDNGYTYYFGGSLDAMEYTLSSVVDYKNLAWPAFVKNFIYNSPAVSAFYLYKIVAPNGRELNIKYRSGKHHYFSSNHYGGWSKLIDDNCYEEVKEELSNFSFSVNWFDDNFASFYPQTAIRGGGPLEYAKHLAWNNPRKSLSLTKIALIKSITTDFQQIEFVYSGIEKPMFSEKTQNMIPEFCLNAGAMLKEVNTYCNYKKIKYSKFEYEYKGEHPRFFLKFIDQSNSGRYKFQYNVPYLPDPLTKRIDHWGFWQGLEFGKEPISLIPKLKRFNFHFAANNIVEKDLREPSEKDFDVSLLKKIEYPTGGSTTFVYEPHDYSKVVKRTSLHGFLPALEDEEGIAGGARIKYTIDESNNKREIKEYVYEAAPFVSSGILTNKVYYHHIDQVIQSSYQQTSCETRGDDYVPAKLYYVIPELYAYFKSSSGFNLVSFDTDHVKYSIVEERKFNILIPDSIWSISFTPASYNDAHKSKMKEVTVQDLSELWTIKYSSGVTVFIMDAFNLMQKFSFSKPGIEKLNLSAHKLGLKKGKTYQVYIICDKDESGGFASVEVQYPRDTKMLNERIKSYFSDYGTHPDIFNGAIVNDNKNDLPVSDQSLYALNFFRRPSDMSFKRGLLLREEVYNRENKLRLVTENNYRAFAMNSNKGIVLNQHIRTRMLMPDFVIVPILPSESCLMQENGFFCMGFSYQLIPFNTSPYLLNSRSITDYRSEDNAVKIIEHYTYDDSGFLLKSKEIENSDGLNFSTQYIYSSELGTEPYQTMTKRGITSALVVESELMSDKSGSSVTPKSKTTYNYALNEVIENAGTANARKTNFPIIAGIERCIGDNKSEMRDQFVKYDSFGNPLYHIKDGSIHTVILWSYIGKYPIAMIENATYDEVKNALDGSILEDISLMRIPDIDKINNLRIRLPSAQVYTYTFKPGVGISTITNANNITTYYLYDTGGRLSEVYEIKDGKKIILQSNEYHYVNENN